MFPQFLLYPARSVFFFPQRFSFVTPARGEGADSSDEDGSEGDSEEEEEGDEEDEDFSGGNAGVGMSEAEERLVASFMNAGEDSYFYF